MRILIATVLAASFLATPVFAGDLPLPAGKPAGVKAAQYEDDTIFFIVGGAAVVAGIVILANNNGSKNITPGTTPVSPSTSTAT